MFESIKYFLSLRSSDKHIDWLRSKGVKIGENTIIRYPMSTRIDLTRPSLISIGDNVDINKNFTIMTHDYSSFVFMGNLLIHQGRLRLEIIFILEQM